jgi:outer membrane receptor protein involved in Fe transport
MNTSPRTKTLLSLIAAFAATESLLPAQTAPAAPAPVDSRSTANQAGGDELIVLSPFEVSASGDSGYAAATSLAGNRLNTDLKDVGSAISVVTSQMLRDIGATSNETLLQYTTNTEVGNIYGNMANAGSGTQLDETGRFSNPNSNTRVRGLASADQTVDYFLTDIPWDGYNVDRIDMQRGPNAMLFGLGSPAGIINAGTKTATLRNGGQVELRYSRFGSIRSTVDYNYVLIPRQLAIHVDGLYGKEKFQQDPAYQTDKRGYGALRFEPAFLNKGSAHTTFKANFEKGNVRSNRPRSLTPGDGITPWFLTGTGTGYRADGTPFTYNNLNRIGLDARGLQSNQVAAIGDPTRGVFPQSLPNGSPNPNWQPWLGGQFTSGYFGNPMAIFDSGETTQSSLSNLVPSTVRGIGPNGLVDRSINGILDSRQSSITIYRDVSKKVNLPGAKFGLTRNVQLSDPSIFDFYNQLLDGPNKSEWQNFHRYNLNLSETLFDGAMGFEAAYDKQHYNNGQLNFMQDKNQNLWIDMTKIQADGSINPNFGRPFVADASGGGSSMFSDREALRVTGFGKYDFDHGQHRNLLTRILGRHVLTGLYSDDTRESESRSWVHYAADNAYKDFINGAGSNPVTLDSSLRKVYPVIYLGSSLADASTAAGANIQGPKVPAVVNGGSIRAFDSTWIATNVNPADPWENPLWPVGNTNRISTQSENPANYRGWVNTPITITNSEEGNREQNTTFASKSKSQVTSKALIWQGYFWDGAVVGMYGFRQDKAKSWAKTADRDSENRPKFDPSLYKYPSTANIVEDESQSVSVVAHLNRFLNDRLPLDVSLFYAKSENFQPVAGRVGPLGNLLTPPTGNTDEIGVTFATKDGKYSLKINKYKTTVVNASGTSGFNSFYLGQMWPDFQETRNRYVFEVSNPQNPNSYHSGTPEQWTYQPGLNQTPAEALALQGRAVAAWDALVKSVPASFFTAWKIDPFQTDISQLRDLTYTTPNGFTIPEDNISKGLEFELYAQPIAGLRLMLNASKQEASRSNVGDLALNQLVTQINTALNTTDAGQLRGPGAADTTALQNWNANFWASWLSVKGQENNAVPELRKWRANFIANYDFEHGFLKGFNIGAGVRWQDKVIIGYKPLYYVGDEIAANPFVATSAKFDLGSPYYGPAETNVDLWIGYTRKLGHNLEYRVQLNVRNVGKGNYLIPVTVQPDGEVASWRIGAPQIWSLTNTLSF